jgi:hypothetical protein
MWTDPDRETYKHDGRRYPSDLSDEEWATIAPLFAGYVTLTVDLREMVNACFYLEKAGCRRRAANGASCRRISVRGKPCAGGTIASVPMAFGRTQRPC